MKGKGGEGGEWREGREGRVHTQGRDSVSVPNVHRKGEMNLAFETTSASSRDQEV